MPWGNGCDDPRSPTRDASSAVTKAITDEQADKQSKPTHNKREPEEVLVSRGKPRRDALRDLVGRGRCVRAAVVADGLWIRTVEVGASERRTRRPHAFPYRLTDKRPRKINNHLLQCLDQLGVHPARNAT